MTAEERPSLAEAMARLTGSVGAAVVVERRDPATGELVVVDVETFGLV